MRHITHLIAMIILLAILALVAISPDGPKSFSSLLTQGSESYADGGSVGRMDRYRISICDNHRNFKNAMQSVSNLAGKEEKVFDANGVEAGCGVRYANFLPKAHVATEGVASNGDWIGVGAVSHH